MDPTNYKKLAAIDLYVAVNNFADKLIRMHYANDDELFKIKDAIVEACFEAKKKLRKIKEE